MIASKAVQAVMVLKHEHAITQLHTSLQKVQALLIVKSNFENSNENLTAVFFFKLHHVQVHDMKK